MREIRFRGKEINSGKWVYGHLFEDEFLSCILVKTGGSSFDGEKETHFDDVDWIEVIPETVGQMTPVKIGDTPVYEGDRIECISNNPFSMGDVLTRNVIMGCCSWWMEGTGLNLSEFIAFGKCKIIGNIHGKKES